jgi:transposase InsO family protein
VVISAEFIAEKVQTWIAAVGAKTAFIEPGSPCENGYCESFNVRFRDEPRNGEVFSKLREAQILIEEWRRHYNTVRHQSALGTAPQRLKAQRLKAQRRKAQRRKAQRRKASSRWTRGPPCTKIQPGPLD